MSARSPFRLFPNGFAPHHGVPAGPRCHGEGRHDTEGQGALRGRSVKGGVGEYRRGTEGSGDYRR